MHSAPFFKKGINMTTIEIFQVLGIEETKDEASIKNAYREKLSVTNPEDNPEGFKRLRTAYEEACEYARRTEEDEVEMEDNTPSGLWVQKAAEIYKRIDTRRNVECWEALFEEDICLSLEEEENCRFKLLRFIMDNYRLPTEVWKLLDEKLGITEDNTGLRENFPGDFINYIINKCRNGEDLEFDQFEGEPEAEYDLFIQYNDQCWEAIRTEQLEQAEEFLKNGDDLEIYHPSMELNRAWLWEKQGKVEDAIEWMLKLFGRYEKDLLVSFHTAEILWRNDRKEKAAEVYKAIKAENKSHYMANVRLTEWYYEQGHFQEAKDCAEDVLGVGGDDNFRELLTKVNAQLEKEMLYKFQNDGDVNMGLELGWCYLQDGKIAEGVDLALSLKDRIPSEKLAEYNGLLTKLHIEGPDYKEAIEMAEIWEQSLYEKMKGEDTEDKAEELKKDKDRVRQSYMVRAHAYRVLGYKDKSNFPKSLEALEKVINELAEKDKPEINAMMEMAKLYTEMEEYEKSLDVCNKLIEEYQIFAAYATMQKTYSHMWDAQGVVQSGYACIHQFPDYAFAYERIAKVYLDLGHTEDLKGILEDAKQAGIESQFLKAYEYQMNHEPISSEDADKGLDKFREEYASQVDKGNMEYYEKGLPIVTEYLNAFPGAYMLVERGLFHRAAGKYEEAEADLDRALAEEPGNAYAYNALAYMFRLQKRYNDALMCLKKAALYFDEEYARVYSNMSALYSLLGLHQKALDVFEDVLRVGGEDIQKSEYYMRRYAVALARCGKVEEAVKVLRNAYSNTFDMYHEIVEVYRTAGRKEEAVVALKKWNLELQKYQKSAMKNQMAEYHDSKAWQELIYGEGETAIEQFETEIKLLRNNKEKTGFCDMIFACILCGEDKKAMHYAAKLRQMEIEEKARGENHYYEMDKSRLQTEILCSYYTATKEELDALLESEKDTCICSFCTYGLCKELEAMRILHMLRVGRKEEAIARLEDNLTKQPWDEYMQAIKKQIANGIKVVSYEVNGVEYRKDDTQNKEPKKKVEKEFKKEPEKKTEKESEKEIKKEPEKKSEKEPEKEDKKTTENQATTVSKIKKLFSNLFKN